MPSVAKPPPRQGEKKKKRKRKRKIVLRVLKLKGLWLKTPEDWAHFMEWAKKNAVPRKYPPPEPVYRGPKKRLSKLKKRLRTLSQPRVRGAMECAPLPIPVPRKALKVVASRRTRRLARPVLRFEQGCRSWRIKRSALLYEPTDTILMLSVPRVRLEPDDCRPLGVVSPAAMRRLPTDKDCTLAQPKQRQDAECEERGLERDDSELSPWVDFLAIPSYRVLKEMHNVELADKYKQRFLDEVEDRSKRAYKEQMKKRKKKKERDKRRKAAQKKKEEETKRKGESVKAKSKYSLGESQRDESDVASDEYAADDATDDAVDDAEESDTVSEQPTESEEPEDGEEEEEEEEKEDDERMKKRKEEKEAWRYVPVDCKRLPWEIPESALHYEATDAIVALAIPKTYEKNLCKGPYTISEEAKNAEASPRVEELAKPKHPREPVKRPEPREKDEWGRPIFPPREFGKKLPKVKPYQTRECPEKKEKKPEEGEEGEGEDVASFAYEYEDESSEQEPRNEATEATEPGRDKSETAKKRRKKPRFDPITFRPTIDPLFDPIHAEKQLKERQRYLKYKQEEAEREKAEKAEAGDAEDDEGVDTNDNEQA